ncbi:mechanosensitive ion channel protein MscS [Thermococcus siculi]|uniref:Mechanosensitive ion channel protein MscS n=1 Tax=Thermococcus siculi TaxID=72803 RepID=A0A2Z2MU79_9EURY|nr:mechanosensitive ion channel family protein [Thermococcus siculi]ASJ09346.1 mechanosensitive ion channel protein MscS [Thermococcus siculi]
MVAWDEPLPYIGVTPFQLVSALIILIVGYIVAKIIVSIFKKSMKKSKLSPIVVEFLARFLAILLYIIVIIVALGAVGVSVSPLILGLSAVIGLILGFGLQDTITNLAAGVWIASLRPIDIGEVVEVSGQVGSVTGIGLMSTVLHTVDNRMITIPNRLVWGSIIVNYTRLPIRRVDVDIGVAYGTDLDRAIKIAMDVMKSHPLVLDDPAPSVAITALADSSINLQLRPWAKTEDYWTVKGDITKAIYEAYGREGIEIPFPQLDVHIKGTE